MRKMMLILVPIAVICVWIWRKPLALASITLLGRGGICSASDILAAPANRSPGNDALERVRQASRIIRDDGRFTLWETPHGPFWVPTGSDFLAFNIAEQEREFYGSNGHDVRPGEVVLDCGANVGVFSRRAIRRGAKVVVAIEPAPENLECLRRNLTAEIASGAVRLVPKGVWNAEGILGFHVDKTNSAADHFVVNPKPDELKGLLQLPITTIDRLASDLALDRVDVIKMDIEGAERNALAGAKGVLAKYRPRLSICTYHRDDDPAAIPPLVLNAAAEYRAFCGPCVIERFRIRPHALYFRAE